MKTSPFVLVVSSFVFLTNLTAFALGTLTQEEAQKRFKQVSDISYKVDLDLTHAKFDASAKSPAEYQGKVFIQFRVSPDARSSSEFIFLDLSLQEGGELKSVLLNDKPVSYQWDSSKSRILFSTSAFKVGDVNQVQLDFTNRFSDKGKGFHRDVDKEDKEAYVYTNLEPFYANEVFPLFDQPDLKATFQLETTAPRDWEVISNTREIQKIILNPQETKWIFGRTDKISTYVFSAIAGPFHIWESQTESKIPLRLMVRKTLAQYINSADWFKITQESFRFYEEKFGFAYPFHKYDQILVPGTASGAMENVGAVTFNERYVTRGKMTPLQRASLAATLSHEMAHMWFGNLVTMKWWDDLWLNESFATFASYLVTDATQKNLGLLGAWETFYSGIKEWAYREDSYQTTHPVVGVVQNTRETTFDGITYAKGASALKQLFYYVGEKNFYNGLKLYFKQYAFQNATRSSFLQAMSEASQLNLASWDDEWLGSKGTNSAKIHLTEKNGKIAKLVIEQFSDPIEHRLRSHRTQLGFYHFNEQGEIVLKELLPVTYSKDFTEINEAVGKELPAFVFLNSGDYDFSLTVLDERTLSQISENLLKIADPLLKQQLYSCLWKMVQHSQISAQNFIQMVVHSTLQETNLSVLKLAFDNLGSSLVYLNSQDRLLTNRQIVDFLSSKLKMAQAGSDLQELVFSNFLLFAQSSEDMKTIHAWLSGQEKVEGIDLNQDRRWKLISTLSRGGFPRVETIIHDELIKDPSNAGALQAQIAEMNIPVLENKKKWFTELGIAKKINFTDSLSLMSSFHNILDESLTDFVEESYLSTVLSLVRTGELDRKVSSFATLLYPRSFSKEFSLKAKTFLQEQEAELPLQVRNSILRRIDDSSKIRKARRIFSF